MSNNLSPFRIEIFNASGTPIGGGSVGNIISMNDTRKLDSIGFLEFEIPASDRIAKYINTGVKFKAYDEIDGYLGQYLFRNKSVEDRNGNAIMRVTAYDALKELTQITVGTNRNYNNETVTSVISEVVALADNWSASVTENSNTTVSYSYESILRAVDTLRDRKGVHYRHSVDELTGNNILEFGPFGSLSSLYFDSHKGQVTADYLQAENNVIILNANLVEESDEIFNKIIPLGFGQGESQLTIKEADLGDYPTETDTNKDGSLYYFIKDDVSISNYGTKTRILSLPNIRPISNSDANITLAANALKLTAEAYIKKHLSPRFEYKIDTIGLRQNLKPGEMIDVRYNQETNGSNYLSIEGRFWVMDITRNRNANGTRRQEINIANIDDRRTSDTDVIIDVVKDIRDLGVHIPATLAYSPVGPYVKRIKGSASAGSRISPIFNVRLKEEVVYLNRALLRFATGPLKSSVTTTASGGGATSGSGGSSVPTTSATGHRHTWASVLGTPQSSASFAEQTFSFSDGTNIWYFNALSNFNPGSTTQVFALNEFPEHTHTVSIPNHTHTIPNHTHNMQYDVFNDTVTPIDIEVWINGENVTTTLTGGDSTYFDSGGSNDIEVDITDILLAKSGGWRTNHDIQFVSTTDSRGEIEFECDLLVTIQPIRFD